MLATILLMLLIVTWLVADLRHQVREKIELQDKLDKFKLPARYILEEPECSNRLIRAMGIANVRIQSRVANQSGGSPPR